MSHNPTYLAWISLCTAIILWGGVGFFGYMIQKEESNQGAHIAQLEALTQEASQTLILHTLVQNTAPLRSRLKKNLKKTSNQSLRTSSLYVSRSTYKQI